VTGEDESGAPRLPLSGRAVRG